MEQSTSKSSVNPVQLLIEKYPITKGRRKSGSRKKRKETPNINSSITSPTYQQSNSPDYHLLSNWGLPNQLIKWYASNGITRLFEWQAECLCIGNVLRGENLVYSAPTSAGKTMVAEIIMYKHLIERKKKAMMIMPFVSITREKMLTLKKALRKVSVKVDAFAGSVHPRGGFARVDVAVCTIEKANSMINRLIEERKLQTIGIIVVDELHMLGDASRGYLLELLLTKVLFLNSKHNYGIQIIGMSATLPNLPFIAKWLKAQLYITEYRPVPLHKMVAVGDALYDDDLKEIRRIDINDYRLSTDDRSVYFAIETILEGNGVLLFCSTKGLCEKLARDISSDIFKLGANNRAMSLKTEQTSQKLKEICITNYEKVVEVLEQLRRTPAGLDKTLEKTIKFRVAFHHAGLTIDERNIIENSFREGTLKVICATSTLSAGVNLPARRVIVRSPFDFRGSLMDILVYNQMIGRAGRKGVDTKGESILICTKDDKYKALELIKGDPRPISSCLVQKSCSQSQSSQTKTDKPFLITGSLKRAILEIIANGIAETYHDVYDYMSNTLFSANQSESLDNTIQEVIHYLTENKLLHDMKQQNDSKRTVPTKLGKAVLASAISPDEGLFILEELTKAKKCICLSNDLHLLYEVTPPSVTEQIIISWQHYYDIWAKLNSDFKYVGNLVGIKENHLIGMMQSNTMNNNGNCTQILIMKRFYVALALYDLIHEIPLHEISEKFKAGKGVLQSLQQTASTFAGMITVFCNRLGWNNLEILFEQFQSRLYFGIQRELIDLMRITCLTSETARHLFNKGFDTVATLACAKVSDIEIQLMNSGPFQKDKDKQGEILKVVWSAGQCKAVNEKEMAQAIVMEARELVQKDLGIKIDTWSSSGESTVSNQDANLLSQAYNHNNNKGQKRTKSFASEDEYSNKEKSIIDKEAQELMEKDPEIEKFPFEEELSNSPPVITSFVDENQSQSMVSISDNEFYKDFDEDLLSIDENIELVPSVSNDKKDDQKIEDNQVVEPLEDSEISKQIDNNELENLPLTQAEFNKHSSKTKNEDGNWTSSPLSNKQVNVSPSFDDLSFSYCQKLPDMMTTFDDDDYSMIERTPSMESLESMKSLEESFNTSYLEAAPTKFNEIKIGDQVKKIVVNNKGSLLETLMNNWANCQSFSIMVNIEKCQTTKSFIGKISKKVQINVSQNSQLDLNLNNLYIKNMTVCFDGKPIAYYISSEEVLEEIKNRLSLYLDSSCKIITFDIKQTFQVFRNFFKIDLEKLVTEIDWYDPRIAHWLFDPESRRPERVSELIKKYIPHFQYLLPLKDDVVADQCISTCLLFPLINVLNEKLNKDSIYNAFKNIEIQTRFVIGEMEITGIGIDKDYAEKQQSLLENVKEQLESKAFKIAKRRFKLSSPDQVAEVLYGDLKLLSYLYKEEDSQRAPITSFKTRKLPKHLKTSKPVLKKLFNLSKHPMVQIILDWRKVDHALKKTLLPILEYSNFKQHFNMYRVNCVCDDWSATGRISLEDPNLIGINKDFVIDDVETEDQEKSDKTEEALFTLRKIITACDGHILVGADYSQLELRILAHLSGDENLRKVLNEGGDVFKSIAAVWKSKTIEQISAEERQQAKHICYGMIYGIGAKSLSETLGVTEDEAREFKTTFLNRYAKVKEFIQKTVDACRNNDEHFVETLNGRKRFLPNIECGNNAERAHAERQAVNTTIQGSASDLVKSAMIAVDRAILKKKNSISAKLVLQMHDELMYEVLEKDANQFAILLRKTMESCSSQLTVQLPVKVKIGQNWGSMEYQEEDK